MATDLYIISNINISKEEILEKKDEYLEKLKSLNLEPYSYPRVDKLNLDKCIWIKAEGDWKYELPQMYDENTDSIIPYDDSSEILYFSSPFVFNINVYEKCLELSTIYRYSFLYEDYKTDYLLEFRKNIKDIISIFGGSEIIYLADNGCNKLSTYLELKVWEGVSYNDVKKNMQKKGLPFVSDYHNLKLENLDYTNIKEIVFDDFKDL